MLRFRGGLVSKAHRLCILLNSRLESNKEEEEGSGVDETWAFSARRVPQMSIPLLSQRAKLCSGSEAGSYLRLIDFSYHSTLGLRVMKKKRPGRSR